MDGWMDGGCDPLGNELENEGFQTNHFSVVMKFIQQSTTQTLCLDIFFGYEKIEHDLFRQYVLDDKSFLFFLKLISISMVKPTILVISQSHHGWSTYARPPPHLV